MDENRTYAYELISETVGVVPVDILDTRVSEGTEDVIVEMDLKIDEDDVEPWAFGIIFALGVLSFDDARPRGASGDDFVDDDEWSTTDMFRHLRFRWGQLHFYADYVRGRMMKTDVTIRRDGSVSIRTVNRGTAATRWVTKLQGKKTLSAVSS